MTSLSTGRPQSGPWTFIDQELKDDNGRLLARYREGESAYLAYLDDYAFLTWGLLELYEATFEAVYLKKAVELSKHTISLFWDKEDGGFFFYGEDAERLITRPKEIYDGALPSGNSVMLVNLLRLARLTGKDMLQEIAEKQARYFAGEVAKHPGGYSHFLIGVDFLLGPTREIVITGRAGDTGTEAMLKATQRHFIPEAVVAFHPEGKEGREIEELVPFLKEQKPVDGKATAYVCRNYACQAPINDLAKFMNTL